MANLFAGVENFSPALEGQRIAIGAGSAMRQGLQGIEEIGRMDRMKKELDALKSQYERAYLDSNASRNPNWEWSSMYSNVPFGD